jgi:hypothetical protein
MAEASITVWLEKAFRLIPIYLSNLFRLIAGPKRFIAECLASNKSPVQDALAFCAISVLIGWLLELQWMQFASMLDLARDGAFFLIWTIVFGGALYLAWRLVGGKCEIHKFLTISVYYAGVLKLMMSILFLAILGTMRAADPLLYTNLVTAVSNGTFVLFLQNHQEQLLSSPGYQWSVWIQLPGFATILIWLITGWGAYRQLYGVSRIRSIAAGLLLLLLCIPATALTFVIANGLTAPLPHGVGKPA